MPTTSTSHELGDLVSRALTTLGITEGRVARWIGRPCGCESRRLKLNALSLWAKRVLKGKTERASEYLNTLLEEPP